MENRRVLAPGGAALVEALAQAAAVVVLVAEENGLPVVIRGGILERTPEVVLAGEVRANGGRVERRPVGELHSVPKLERPVLPVRGGPLRGQPRPDQSRSRLQRDQTLEDLLSDAERLPVRDEGRI